MQQLKIATLDNLANLGADEIAGNLSASELASVMENLRSYLWKQKILPSQLKELETYHIPIETLGVSEKSKGTLKSKNIETVSEFVWKDSAEQLTAGWSEELRLAVRIRIFCLLLLPPDKLQVLKSTGSETNHRSQAAPSRSTIGFPNLTDKAQSQRSERNHPSLTASSIVESTTEGDIFRDDLFPYHPWLSFQLPEDFSQPPLYFEKFLFEDVYNLPIATSRRHEIWAGAQMKASSELQTFIGVSLGKKCPPARRKMSPNAEIFVLVYGNNCPG